MLGSLKTVIILCTIASARAMDGVTYLQRYGYIEDRNTSLVDQATLKTSIEVLQDRFNLTVDGTFNQETLQLISKCRCGNTDSPQFYSASNNSKWFKDNLIWYWYGESRHIRVIDAAFSVWAKHANLKFTRSFYNPDILISMGRNEHHDLSSRTVCTYPFDGPGNVLGHAFPPTAGRKRVEIHIDESEDWEFDMVIPTNGKISFYNVLIHEIGHALGLSHSVHANAVMYPIYGFPKNITNIYEYDLYWDDIFGIRFLYGFPSTSTVTSTTTTTTTTVSPPSSTPRVQSPFPPTPSFVNDLCNYKNKISTILVANKHIFVFYTNYVWVLDLDNTSRQTHLSQPKILAKWLTFLPNNVMNISAMYERPNGELVIFVNRDVYFIDYPSLRLLYKKSLDDLVAFRVGHIDAAVNSNKGITYVIFDNEYVFQLDECTLRGQRLGSIKSIFVGIPNNVQGAFRFTNGRLYFITRNNIYEYDEFSNTVRNTVSNVFDVLTIDCFKYTIMGQIYDMVERLTYMKSSQ